MKNIILIIIIGIAGVFYSCDNILNTTPTDFLSPVNYFNTEADLNSSLASAYSILGDATTRVYNNYGLVTSLSISDEFFFIYTSTGYKVMDISSNELNINRFWEGLYQGINYANNLLENVDKPDISVEKRNNIKGQALFLRAYYYFLLVDNFGDVPLKLSSTKSPTDALLPRTPSIDVYAQIVKDMKKADSLVLSINNYAYNGRITKTVVQGILSKVYLTMAGAPLNDKSKYAEALEYTDKVIKSGYHELNPDYKTIFINHSKDIYDTKECLWEAEFYGNNTSASNKEGGVIGIANGITSVNGQDPGYSAGEMHTTRRLFKLYESATRDTSYKVGTSTVNAKIEYSPDKRRDWNVAPYVWTVVNSVSSRSYFSPILTTSNTQIANVYSRCIGKWRREYETILPKTQFYNSTNFPILRYSDVLLMYAEASNEVNNGPNSEAYEAVNKVRRRGYGLPINTPNATVDVSGLNKDSFFKLIMDERARELAFEGSRCHDLKRWGGYITNMKSLVTDIATDFTSGLAPGYSYASNAAKNITDKNVLFPIPTTESSINKLVTQNPGW